jgi:hypothetical protein
VCSSDLRFGVEVGGQGQAEGAVRRGHDVVVCTGDPAGPAIPGEPGFDSYEHSGVRVHRYRRGSRAPEAEYNDPAFGRWFRKFLKDQVPDLVHFFHLGNLSATAIDVCRDLDVPMVMTCTDYWLICPSCQLRLPDNSQCLGPDPDHVNCKAATGQIFNLGGGLSNMDHLYTELPRLIPRHVFSDVIATPILRNWHGDSSGVRGAAWLWPTS